MVFKNFIFGVTIRVVFMAVFISMAAYNYLSTGFSLLFSIWVLFAVIVMFNLIHYCNDFNKKVTKFLESIRYADFNSNFSTNNKKGKTFKTMNKAFNEVLNAFKKIRSEAETQNLVLYTVLQHIQTGIISFNSNGRVGIINNSAKKLLGIGQMKNIEDLEVVNQQLHETFTKMRPGQNFLIKTNPETQLSINSTGLKMDGQYWTLVAIQNIQNELRKHELDAWQNLTKVLRHEIMNSITPISTLVSSLNDIIIEDAVQTEKGDYSIEEESYQDICDGLKTIENRSRGLLRFVNAYREYSNIPETNIEVVNVKILLQSISQLLKEDFQNEKIELNYEIKPEEMVINADEELIEMVLINLLKNAKEALLEQDDRKITVKAFNNGQGLGCISVTDNGPGIEQSKLDRIFIPFYTTKKEGSGIGLALARQIMQLHGGDIKIFSTPGKETTFSLHFRV
ncbi:sensor histidine kinase [Marinigracilibium pacificum]|uniref:histidine kinase n=1 Tax=Marinigracilibium pacificum TaxID=2729599 RepID=A0A848J464_9BACT|nr:HAMP domain-containing sensor histidine kinase [Marinigracilibium pacificum]NMM50108.1 HAMP domain-containing histidine kinase [Marinigracilibium pacificum]